VGSYSFFPSHGRSDTSDSLGINSIYRQADLSNSTTAHWVRISQFYAPGIF
jgi:hypothetical protein